jgi:predicted amidohydrolase YtcJ
MIASLMLAAALTQPNLALVNGKIWTGDPTSRFVEAVAIAGNRIVAAGTRDDAMRAAGPHARIIDLRGRVAVPGFIDNHVHFIDGGLEISRVQLRDAATPQELGRRIGEYARKIGKGKWVMGGQWDHTIWNPPDLPTRQLIDALTPDNPVFVSRLDGHMALANTQALSRTIRRIAAS